MGYVSTRAIATRGCATRTSSGRQIGVNQVVEVPVNRPRRPLRQRVGSAYDKALSQLPGRVSARIDLARPSLLRGWGGPLNGQRHRRQVVRDLFRAIDFACVVETGTFRGHTTQFFAALTEAPVRGIEVSERYAEFARHRCVGYPNVDISLGDSRSFLRTTLPTMSGPTFFYLDAHWYDDLPLADEVAMIAESRVPAVVMIDDFEVPGDPGYGFDDYGPGRRLDETLVTGVGADGWSIFYPAVAAADESGPARGCVVLTSPDMAATVTAVAGLRASGTLD